MLEWLWIVPALPLAGFAALALLGPLLPRRVAAALGTGAAGGAMIVAVAAAWQFIAQTPAAGAFTQPLWQWMRVGGLDVAISLRLDELSLVMMLVVTVVGFLIVVYSIGYMSGDEGYSRFFAYMNLFVALMLLLVLADNLVAVYLGWEGVGLCSYLLIGFWYRDKANGRAARKAFIVTRLGDIGLIVGLLLIFDKLGTLNIQQVLAQAAAQWPAGSTLAVAVAALLLAGAVGKSAQLPLQVWLPDAMAGPTPVSALIHAATMVTAGVYLIARMHVLFKLAPPVMLLVAMIGAATLLIAGVSAATQRDIKRVIAYSTISQIGYMFLALGIGAWAAGVFHIVTHAFFKSLLFLGAGVIIHALSGEQDLFQMGGLRRALPLTFWMFLIAAAALAGLPPTGGFASKEAIVYFSYGSPQSHWALFAAALAGVFLTGLYTFRMVFLAFLGPPHRVHLHKSPPSMLWPLVALAAGVLGTAVLEWPHDLGGRAFFFDFLERALPPATSLPVGQWTVPLIQAAGVAASLAGIAAAWFITRPARQAAGARAEALRRFWQAGWGFDWLYNKAIIAPLLWLVRLDRHDVVDRLYIALEHAAAAGHRGMARLQTGQIAWYALAIAAGTVAVLTIMTVLA
ncbi:MAG: NADH-quinone oxidoreductase subunit L [Planctomycetaceae bacterium]|nr:NADH-quinone oxidoreductase subunit L [Planctomycetaceae bacterium]